MTGRPDYYRSAGFLNLTDEQRSRLYDERCRACGADRGERCRTPGNLVRVYPHADRVRHARVAEVG